MDATKAQILVIVHPGSACGSADMNLDLDAADQARGGLMEDIDFWKGGVVVIDGEFSDELERSKYSDLGKSIVDALARARAAGLISHREFGDDNVAPHQDTAVRKVIRKFKLSPETAEISLTGCWRHPDEENTGCVNGVRDDFRERGFRTEILGGAVSPNVEDYDYADQEEDEEASPLHP